MGGSARTRMARLWREESMATRVADPLLWPFELGYGAVVALRNAAYHAGWLAVQRISAPVLSVGNLSVGGTGKTPVAAWLAGQLVRRGRQPALLHGGYGEDEPALHRLWLPSVPVYVDRDRVRSARRAVADGADVLILDDGFQHRRLHRDLDLVLVAAEEWSTRRHLLPRGPWRERLESLRRADMVLVTHKSASPRAAAAVVDALVEEGRAGAVAQIAIRPAGWTGPKKSGEPWPEAVAVIALANPWSFIQNAAETGVHVREALIYPDHFRYGPQDATDILTVAAGRSIVTSEKDWVKLASHLANAPVWRLRQSISIERNASRLEAALDRLGA